MQGLSCVLLLLLSLMATDASSNATTSENTDIARLVEDNTKFGLDLYAQLHATEGNVFFAPYSMSTALAMTFAGARGETKKQMADVMYFTQDQRVHDAFGKLQKGLEYLQGSEGITLRIANGLWAQSYFPFRDSFLHVAHRNYQAELQQADFESAHESVRQEINAWVERQTQDKIKDLLTPGTINQLTRLVLVNAIYFKGNWASQFEKSSTKNAAFWTTPDKSINVPMMRKKERLYYMENDKVQALRLPYENKALSMIIVLPRTVGSFAEFERTLTFENLNRWLNGLEARRVDVYLPRFKVTAKLQLRETLASMGMPNAFGPAADFSGIDGTKQLAISDVIHKSFIEVNEEGAEAGAATGAVIGFTSDAPAPVVVFRADHPFFFLIRERQSQSILFLGRLSDPTEG